jgi:hypothetical protein
MRQCTLNCEVQAVNVGVTTVVLRATIKILPVYSSGMAKGNIKQRLGCLPDANVFKCVALGTRARIGLIWLKIASSGGLL